ncbi:MAG TPA: NDP-sugar synthase [Nitrospirae bacterium]|nr:NDP-sugar synthase [Nitrospirota bacterium]
MNVMILAAGLGTRLLPITKNIPKPLLPVIDKTLLQIAIETACKADPNIVVINASYLSDKIIKFLTGRDFGVEIKVSVEPDLLGTAGGIKAVEKWLNKDDFGVINSDIITTVDWDALENTHKTSGATATLMLRGNPDPAIYGPLCVNEKGRVVRFVNTKNRDLSGGEPLLMFTGVSMMSPSIFERIPGGRAVEISSEIYSPMVASGESLYGYVTQAEWTDAGSMENYHKAVMARFETCETSIGMTTKSLQHVTIRPPVHIDQGVHIRAGSTIGPNVAIHEGSVIGASVLLKNCVVTPRSNVRSGAFLDGEVI